MAGFRFQNQASRSEKYLRQWFSTDMPCCTVYCKLLRVMPNSGYNWVGVLLQRLLNERLSWVGCVI